MKITTRRNAMVFVLLVMMLGTVMCSTETYAASKNSKAHAVFRTQIRIDKYRFNTFYLDYAYVDLDNDKVDELITYPNYGYCTQIIYKYKNGRAVKILETGQGTFTSYYKRKRVIFMKDYGHMGTLMDIYYKYKGGRYVNVASVQKYYGSRSYDQAPLTRTYYIGQRKVSYSKYAAYVRKLIKGDTVKKFKKLKWKKY